MAIESAEDLDIFFDPEECGTSALYTSPGGVAVNVVVIQDEGDATPVFGRSRFVAAANHFMIRADKVTPEAKGTLDLLDCGGFVTESYVLQGEPVLQKLGSIWYCPAIPA